LNQVGVLRERIDEYPEEFFGVVNLLCVLSDDPYQRGFGFWFVQLLEVRA